jgi:hypothetical protein
MSRPRFLLCNPPVYDSKLHWPGWHEPKVLLGASTYLRERGIDVRFLDALAGRANGSLPRQLARRFVLDGMVVRQWRYGIRSAAVRRALIRLREESWCPERALIECHSIISWRGAQEISALIASVFPCVPIHVIGDIGRHASYVPGCGLSNVETSGSLAFIESSVPAPVAHAPTDWNLWRDDCSVLGTPERDHRSQAAIGYLQSAHAPEMIGEGLRRATAAGIRLFAPAHIGERVGADALRATAEATIRTRGSAALISIGNISAPDLLTGVKSDPELPALLRRAGFRQLFIADDRESPVRGRAACASADALVEVYRELMPSLARAGFVKRSDAINAGMSLGRAYEDLAARAALATRLTQVVGALVVWPYEPTPEECVAHGGPRQPELQNGKLYPLRHTSEATHRDMLNICGLAVILNSKYREFTFDFGGRGMIARLFRDSIARRAWEAPDDVKGTLRLPALPQKADTNVLTATRDPAA